LRDFADRTQQLIRSEAILSLENPYGINGILLKVEDRSIAVCLIPKATFKAKDPRLLQGWQIS
jgi:hypothetical protein